jgi:predicted Zn-dependent protease
VADAVTVVLDPRHADTAWEVVLFQEDSANAFALPGGKIGVHSGLLKVARNQDQLATVLAHEVAHVIAEHSNERVSTAYATQGGLQIVQALAGGASGERSNLMALLGLGAQFGVLMPFSRVQESEADVIGLELMARAGFDPRESIRLWENMGEAGGGEPPEFLSTHPSHGRRISDLQSQMPKALELYKQAQAQGRRPQCS